MKKEIKPKTKKIIGSFLAFFGALFIGVAFRMSIGFGDWIKYVITIPEAEWTLKLSFVINWLTIFSIALILSFVYLGDRYIRIGYKYYKEGKHGNLQKTQQIIKK